jgi:sugar O-acyltransferase (sialic acid O-acetyltransferase NeuD family)
MQGHPDIIIVGCGGHARSVADVILYNDPGTTIVFVDINARHGETIFGFPVCGSYNIPKRQRIFVAIGDNYLRKSSIEELDETINISVLSKLAHIGQHAVVGCGSFVGNFVHVGPEVEIGKGTIINTSAVIEHEVKIGSYCHLAPNSSISGRCRLGDLVFVGVSATLKDSINICSNTIIGAGATVTSDIYEPGTYVGTPARKISK